MRPAQLSRWIARVAAVSLASCPLTAAAQTSKADTDRAYYAANGMLNRGLFEEAIPEYEQFLAANPRHEKAPVARYGLGVCQHRLGRYEAAEATLSTLTGERGFAFAAEVQLLLGHCALARGDYAQAADRFAGLLKAHPDHPGRIETAALLVESLHRAARHEEAVRAAARIQADGAARDRADLFAATSEMALGKHADAERRLSGLLARSPADADHAALLRAQCLQRLGRDADAAQAFAALLKDGPGRFAAESMLGLAQSMHRNDDAPGAAAVLDDLLAREGESATLPAAALLRARIDVEAGEYAKARERLKGVATDKSLAADAAYWSARCEMGLGRHAQAADALRAALAEFAQSDLRHAMMHDLALALRNAGRLDEARAAAAAALASKPPPESAAASMHLLAAVAHEEGDHAGCVQACERFLRDFAASPQAPAVEFLRAESLYLAGDLAKAAEAFTRFLARHPRDAQAPAAELRLGLSLWKQGKGAEAAPHLHRAAEARQRGGGEGLDSALLALGDIRFSEGNWSEAERCLRDYLDASPDAAGAEDAMMRLALSLQRQGRYDEAIATCDALLARFPKGAAVGQAAFERGQSLLALGRDDEAAAVLQQVAHSGDTRLSGHALSHLGAIALRKGDPARAAELFAQAGESSSGDAAAEARYHRACALLSAGKYADAARAFDDFVKANPGNARATEAGARRAISLSRDGKTEDALRALDALGADAAKLDASLRALVAYERAWALRALGRDDQAAEAWRRLADSNPSPDLLVRTLADLAGLDMKQSKFDSAAALLERSLVAAGNAPGLDPVRADAVYRLGICELRLEQFDAAAGRLAGYGERFSGSPLVGPAALVRGEALFKAGKARPAAEELERALAASQEPGVAGPALLRLGECRAAMQQWSASEEALRTYLERFPDSELWFQARFGLGWACESQGRLGEAMEEYARVASRHEGPTAARAQFQIGECLFAQKKHEEAVREFLKVDILFAVPEWSAAALYEAGRCFEELGKRGEARQQYAAVTENHAGTKWSELAGRRLAALAESGLPGR